MRCSPRAGTSSRAANAPSSREPIERRCAHRFGRPPRQNSHSPHVEKYVSLTTRSPTDHPVTPSPSSRTTPDTSCPIVTGGSDGNSSSQMCRSVPQMPAPTTSSTTWPGRTSGSGRSVSSTAPGPVFVTPSISVRP